MTTQPANVSVTLPISPAIERVKLLLFRPFDLGKWFAIGFCAWLATLGQHGFSFNYNRRLATPTSPARISANGSSALATT